MISKDKITEIFCCIDDFTQVFEQSLENSLISSGKKTRRRKFKMSKGEILYLSCEKSLHRTQVFRFHTHTSM